MVISLYMSLLAFSKSYSLVSNLEDEIIWIGKAYSKDKIFIVDDIYVPPQEVTTSSASINGAIYSDWIQSLCIDQNCINYYAHFHPNGYMEPSRIDNELYNNIKKFGTNNGLAVFSIWSRDGKCHNMIYDHEAEYYNDDIEFVIYGEEFNSKDFIKTTKKIQHNIADDCLNKHKC